MSHEVQPPSPAGRAVLQGVHEVGLSVVVESFGEHVASGLGDEQWVFKLRRQPAILRHRRPVVWPQLVPPDTWHAHRDQCDKLAAVCNMVGLRSRTSLSPVRCSAVLLSCSDPGQVVHTHVHASCSSRHRNCYRPGSNAGAGKVTMGLTESKLVILLLGLWLASSAGCLPSKPEIAMAATVLEGLRGYLLQA